jgi:hypothetical protein
MFAPEELRRGSPLCPCTSLYWGSGSLSFLACYPAERESVRVRVRVAMARSFSVRSAVFLEVSRCMDGLRKFLFIDDIKETP